MPERFVFRVEFFYFVFHFFELIGQRIKLRITMSAEALISRRCSINAIVVVIAIVVVVVVIVVGVIDV